MDPNISNTMDPTGDKRLPETGVHTNISHNMTTIQKIQHLQTVGNITATNVSTMQSGQSVVNAVASSCNTIVGESINQKLPFIKSNIQSGSTQFSSERGKITTLCGVGQPVRIIPPGTLTNVERQTPVQGQTQQIQASQQVVTTLSHLPRGPAAVANISAPRSTVATPIVKATGQSVLPISRPGINTTVSNQPQWANRTPLIYAQPPRPPVSRITNRPPAVYSAQSARIVTPGHVRAPVQTTTIVQPPVVATVTTGAPTRLTPVLQSNNALIRNTGSQVRPTGPQITNTIGQPIRHQPQTIQTNQIVRTLSGTPTTTNRVTVTAPIVATASRIISVTASGTVQPAGLNRQLTINSSTGPTQTTLNRVVASTQALQQVQPSQIQGHSINTNRAVQAMLPNISGVARVITASNSSNTRVTQSQQAPIGRLAGMALPSLPLSRPQQPSAQTTTTTTSTIKTIPGQIQLKTNAQPLRVTPSNIPTTIVTTSSSSSSLLLLSTPPPPPPPSSTTATTIINNTTINNNSNNTNNNNNINSPTQLSQGSMYTQYRPVTTPPMRITAAYIVDSSHDDTHGKPNASPRPSILRKRDHDNSPAKNIAKNLAPVLALLQASPPLSPPRDRESGNQSSGSTTVSATSSPGLDDEPEQSRITIINQTMEMSPRKKPRKQQLTGVELTESRCTEEEMQFITEDKLKRDTINDNIIKDKYCINRKTNIHLQNDGHIGLRNQTDIIKRRPRPRLLGSSWKSRCNSRLHHYRRPSDVRPKEERRPTVAEIGQQKHVLQKIDGWKVYQLTAQMEDLAELEKQVHERFKAQLVKFESQQTNKNRQDDGNDSEKMLSDRVNELIKGNMQRSSLISEGIIEARSQLITIFEHKSHVNEILQRCGNTKRSQKKRDK